MGGDLDVDSSSISLVVGRHVGGGVAVSDTAYLGFSCVDRSLQLVDPASGFGEALVGDSAAAVNGGNEAMGNGARGICEGTVLHAEEGRS